MSDPQGVLKNFPKNQDYLVAIDSDGCAFDSMEIKHKECVIPNLISFWRLQAVARYVRQTAEFVNLYSSSRGVNRWPALVTTFDLLRSREEVRRRGATVPALEAVRGWIERTPVLSNAALKAEIERHPDPELKQALAWSEAVNNAIHQVTHGTVVFPLVRESLATLSEWADVMICAETPCTALQRTWDEHNLTRHVRVIAGQEMGPKSEQLRLVAAHYDPSRVLMLGDAPGDREAAQASGVRFFPIVPRREEESWRLFFEEVAGKFYSGAYDLDQEQALIKKFDVSLPKEPAWSAESEN